MAVESIAKQPQGKTYFTGKPCKYGHVAPRNKKTRQCMECAKVANKKWRSENKDALYLLVKTWRDENRDRFRKWNVEYDAKPRNRVASRISHGILGALRDKKSGMAWESIVGYSLDDLIGHLERQFVKGMALKNIGEWHIDHIVPKAAFDLLDEKEVIACWALPNLRPIWASENCSKRASRTHLI